MANTKKTETEIPYNPDEDRVIVNIAPPTEEDEGKIFPVSVNNYHANIAYGEDVKVPRYVAEALMYRKVSMREKKQNEAKRTAKAAKMQ